MNKTITFRCYLYIIESITEFIFCLRIFLRICVIFVRLSNLSLQLLSNSNYESHSNSLKGILLMRHGYMFMRDLSTFHKYANHVSIIHF